MTIQSETRLSGPYTGTGLVTVYPFTFKVFQASDLLVIQTDTSGNNTTLALTSNYSVSLNPDQNSNPGGSITLVSALPASYTLVISSQIPYQQTLDILNNQTWYPQVIEDALDRLTILIQQVKQSLGNALQLPLSSSGVSTTLPNPVASNFLGWNSAANAIINYAGVASAAVSTYMSGFIALTTAAAARAYIAAVGLADANTWTNTNVFSSTTTVTDTLTRILKNGSSFYARILATNLTANRDITLPDASFTVPQDSLVVHNTGNETIAGVKTFSSMPILPVRSEVVVNTANGYGSTNTAIRRFTNSEKNVGSDITYADSATLGGSFTINADGVYAMSYTDIFSSAANLGISINTTVPTTSIVSIPIAEQIANQTTYTANAQANCGATRYLTAGTVIRAHTSAATTGGLNIAKFSIIRIG